MNPQERDLIIKTERLAKEISCYIMSNPDWIYYFVRPKSILENEVRKLIRKNPKDWKDYFGITIKEINPKYITVSLDIEGLRQVECNLYLSNFELTIETNKKLVESTLNGEEMLNQIKADISFYERKLKESKNALNKITQDLS